MSNRIVIDGMHISNQVVDGIFGYPQDYDTQEHESSLEMVLPHSDRAITHIRTKVSVPANSSVTLKFKRIGNAGYIINPDIDNPNLSISFNASKDSFVVTGHHNGRRVAYYDTISNNGYCLRKYKIWTRLWTPANQDDYSYIEVLSVDENYVWFNYRYGDELHLVKMDHKGNIIWDKAITITNGYVYSYGGRGASDTRLYITDNDWKLRAYSKENGEHLYTDQSGNSYMGGPLWEYDGYVYGCWSSSIIRFDENAQMWGGSYKVGYDHFIYDGYAFGNHGSAIYYSKFVPLGESRTESVWLSDHYLLAIDHSRSIFYCITTDRQNVKAITYPDKSVLWQKSVSNFNNLSEFPIGSASRTALDETNGILYLVGNDSNDYVDLLVIDVSDGSILGEFLMSSVKVYKTDTGSTGYVSLKAGNSWITCGNDRVVCIGNFDADSSWYLFTYDTENSKSLTGIYDHLGGNSPNGIYDGSEVLLGPGILVAGANNAGYKGVWILK